MSITPAQQVGWKIGDRGFFNTRDSDVNVRFSENAIIEFCDDDETAAPCFKLVSGYSKHNDKRAFAGLDEVTKLKGTTTPHRGDYVKAELIKDENQFERLKNIFVAAGAIRPNSGSSDGRYVKGVEAVGWDVRDGRFYAPTINSKRIFQGNDAFFTGRSLTPEQLLGEEFANDHTEDDEDNHTEDDDVGVDEYLTGSEWIVYCKGKAIEAGLEGDGAAFRYWMDRYTKM